jgi:hypothetical protein
VWHTFAFVFVDIFAAGEAVPEGAPPARPGGRAGYHQPLRGAFVRVDSAALPVTFPPISPCLGAPADPERRGESALYGYKTT